MIKILFLIPNLGHGGAEKVLVNLVNHMDKKKFQITLMTLYDEGVNKEFLSEHITYKACFSKSVKGVSQMLKLCSPSFLYKWLIKGSYDVAVSYLEGQTARIISGCPANGTKLISWIHVEQHTQQKAAHCFRSIEEMKKCYFRFDQTVCVSEYVKNDFCSIVPVKNAVVLYNTVESDKIRYLSNEEVKDIFFSKDEIKLCGIGTLKKSKGFDRLLRVHKRLLRDGYPVHTYILGEGEEQLILKSYIENENIASTVTFLGYKKNPYKYVKQCDVFVCTSYAEGFSTAATEALIIGVPVCTMEVSGMKEMLGSNNEYGIVTKNEENDFYTKLRTLIENKELLYYYKEQAKKRGEIFNTQSTVEATESLFENLVKQHD